MTESINYIPNRVRNAAVGGHVCGSVDIIDDDLGLEQNAINKEVAGAVPYNQANPNGMGRVVLKKNDNFKEVVEAQTNGNTIFVIKYDYTLTGDVNIPANCVLQFEGGSILNSGTSYTINGNFGIIAPSVKIFNNVSIPNYTGSFKFIWAVGNKNTLVNADFQKLPNTEIDFENKFYNIEGTIEVHYLEKATFKNLKGILNGSIRHYLLWPEDRDGTCTFDRAGGYYDKPTIITSNQLPSSYIGKLIYVKTATGTKIDNRPDSSGVPTLYKGVTSIIIGIDGNKVTLADYIEPFNDSETYNGTTITPTYNIYNPSALNLENCDISFIGDSSCGISISGYNYTIKNCKIVAQNGSDCILSLGGHSGIINNCIIEGAYYEDTGTSYGIQVNGGTNIKIINSKFKDHRRAVDFSGAIESRYCEVNNCEICCSFDMTTGSALGGHSTSYGNRFVNNRITGRFQVGIQCRGENEIIDGNYFMERAHACDITTSVNTLIKNNIKESNYADESSFINHLIEYVQGNKLTVINNRISCKEIFVYNNTTIDSLIIKNNIIAYTSTSSRQPCILLNPQHLVFSDNIYYFDHSHYNINIAKNSGTIYLPSSIINGVKDLLRFKLYDGSDLSDTEAAKITDSESFIEFNTTSVLYESSFGGKIKLTLKFTVTTNMSVSLSVRGNNELSWFNADNKMYGLGRNIVKYSSDPNIFVAVSSGRFYIGYESYGGKIPAGTYYVEAEM